jgi:hypothetical protein
MKRNRLKIRFWLTMAFAATSLVLASSAGASLYTGDVGDTVTSSPAPVVADPSGFAWADAAIGAAVAVAIVVAALAVAYIARNRSRFAPSH